MPGSPEPPAPCPFLTAANNRKTSDSGPAAGIKTEWPALHMQQPSQPTCIKPLGLDVNAAYEEGREEHGGEAISQTGPQAKEVPVDYNLLSEDEERILPFASTFPQYDGCNDFDDVNDEEPPLDENDDEMEDGDEDPITNNLILAQFDKVNRTKGRWRCTFKCGIMHLNNKDILFAKANGEFDF